MFNRLRHGRWLIGSAFIVASCSQGDAGRLAGPTDPGASAANGAAIVGSLAEGDVRTGSAPLEIDGLRMDRQTPSGASVLRQYAEPGGEYRMEVGETIELWVEWDRGDGEFPKGLIANPRLLVDWGDGGSDFAGCGSCLLKHTYPRAGRFTVTVTLNDLAGTTVTRTFFLNSLDDPSPSCIAPTSTLIDESDCDASTYDVSQFFTGSSLTYELTECSSEQSHDVQALGSVQQTISIHPTTGVITFQGTFNCVQVSATNACGSTTSNEFFLASADQCG